MRSVIKGELRRRKRITEGEQECSLADWEDDSVHADDELQPNQVLLRVGKSVDLVFYAEELYRALLPFVGRTQPRR